MISRDYFDGHVLQTLFRGLPHSLRQDVQYFVGQKFLDRLLCLESLPIWFKKYLSLFLREEIFLVGDRLIKVEDVTTRCFFIMPGGEAEMWEDDRRSVKVGAGQVG